MQFQYQMGRTNVGEPEAREAAFILVESGQAATINKGELCAWDLTSNVAQAGIMKSTFGLRVIVCPVADAGDATAGVVRMAGFAHTAIPSVSTFASVRQGYFLLQVWGYRNDITANTDAASNILAGGLIVPSGDAAGAVEGPQDVTAPTVAEISKICGMSFVAVAINTTATIEAWIRLM